MADRAKALKGLKQHLLVKDGEECVDCPYGEMDGLDCVRQLYADAMELLKAQEPFEPLLGDADHKIWICGNCKVAIFPHGTAYCHNCGRAVKWDD